MDPNFLTASHKNEEIQRLIRKIFKNPLTNIKLRQLKSLGRDELIDRGDKCWK